MDLKKSLLLHFDKKTVDGGGCEDGGKMKL
jgi:hypothetical protein